MMRTTICLIRKGYNVLSTTLSDTISDIESDIATTAVGVTANSLTASGISDEAIADALVIRAAAMIAQHHDDDLDVRKFLVKWLRYSRG